MTCWTDKSSHWNNQKLFLIFLAPLFYHTLLSSAVINVFMSGIKHAWRYSTYCFFIYSSFYWKVTYTILCIHIIFTSGPGFGWKALAGIWLMMNVSFTENLQDEWLTVLGSPPLFWSSVCLILHFDFPFSLFIFHFFRSLFLSFWNVFFLSLVFFG